MSLIDEDIGQFFDAADFGEPMLWRGRELLVQFDDETVRVTTDTDVEHIMPDPRVYVQTTLIAGMQRNEAVMLRNTEYQVEELLPNGVGVTTLELIKA